MTRQAVGVGEALQFGDVRRVAGRQRTCSVFAEQPPGICHGVGVAPEVHHRTITLRGPGAADAALGERHGETAVGEIVRRAK